MATTNLSNYDKKNISSAERYRFGIVVSQWNKEITDNLLNGAKETLIELRAIEKNIEIFEVPGSFELIFGANQLVKKEKYDAVIVIGSIIRGETAHFDHICSAISHGIKDINIISDIPTVFCVLTDNNLQQSIDRSGGKLGNKGVEAAVTAVKMLEFKNRI